MCVPSSFYFFTILLLSLTFPHRSEMPLPTTLENDPILWEEMTVQEKPQVQVATLPACERESETKLAKAPVLMAALPSPINPSSRPMTPESLFGEISDPKYVTYPVPDEAIPPIFIRCMNCWRNDHRKSVAHKLVRLSNYQKDTKLLSNWESKVRISTATKVLAGSTRRRAGQAKQSFEGSTRVSCHRILPATNQL